MSLERVRVGIEGVNDPERVKIFQEKVKIECSFKVDQ